ncbi:MAG TPA: flavin reductase family protein [Cyclobacteriaceae bacterium]|nr:flavin reductase family protein [Cyclobacteriaceae bacterium]
MISIDPKEVTIAKMHALMLGAVAPRPIAFASTIDKAGNVNLSPFSFFNCFSANPPILVFSPARRGRENTTKHSYENVLEVPEATISIVNYEMVQQMSLASTDYPKGVNEFVKAGFTELPSQKVKPPGVAESPAIFECKVNQVISLGEAGGAGNLVICEIVLAHFKEEILDAEGRVDPFKLDAVARMGGDWYCRANDKALFTVPKPTGKIGIGVDQLPASFLGSKELSRNDIGLLAGIEHIPDTDAVSVFAEKPEIKAIMDLADASERKIALQRMAHYLLKDHKIEEAWKALLLAEGQPN